MIRKLLLLTLVAGTAAFGADPDEGAKSSGDLGKYSLKRRSVVHLPMGTRAPFWPIGWVKGAPATAKAAEIAEAKPLLDEKSFRLTSILLGSPALAVINGRAYSEGEFVRMPKGSAAIRVRVQRISDGAVMLQADQQILNVRLQRVELGPKRAELEYLREDR